MQITSILDKKKSNYEIVLKHIHFKVNMDISSSTVADRTQLFNHFISHQRSIVDSYLVIFDSHHTLNTWNCFG